MRIVREQLSVLPFQLTRVFPDSLRPVEIAPTAINYYAFVGDIPVGGVSGGGSVGPRMVYTPPSAQTTWLIPHNFGYRPEVVVRDTYGDVVYTNVTHLDENTCSISFTQPTVGFADLR